MCLATIWPSLFVLPSASNLRPRKISAALEDRSARKSPLRTNLNFVLSVMTTVVSAPRTSRMVNVSPVRLVTMPVVFVFFPSAISVSGAFDPLGSTVNAVLSWPSTRLEQASVIANVTNRICVFLLFIQLVLLWFSFSLALRLFSPRVSYKVAQVIGVYVEELEVFFEFLLECALLSGCYAWVIA